MPAWRFLATVVETHLPAGICDKRGLIRSHTSQVPSPPYQCFHNSLKIGQLWYTQTKIVTSLVVLHRPTLSDLFSESVVKRSPRSLSEKNKKG